MSSPWRPLRVSHDGSGLPPLLIHYEFGPSSYVVLITDLTYIWLERLDRKQLLKRALSLDTTIDPSEDATQMQQFLRRILDSLEDQSGTKLSINRGDAPKHLILNVVAFLPVPLEPLQWPIHLTPATQNFLTRDFVLPCLCQLLNANAQIESLLQHLKDKDHVIDRLADKIQSDGSELSKIFPSTAFSKARNRVDSRESVAKIVKGLGRFNQEEWRTRFTSHSGNIEDVIFELFAPAGTFKLASVAFEWSGLGTWWDLVREDGKEEAGDVSEYSRAGPEVRQALRAPKTRTDLDLDIQVRHSLSSGSESCLS